MRAGQNPICLRGAPSSAASYGTRLARPTVRTGSRAVHDPTRSFARRSKPAPACSVKHPDLGELERGVAGRKVQASGGLSRVRGPAASGRRTTALGARPLDAEEPPPFAELDTSSTDGLKLESRSRNAVHDTLSHQGSVNPGRRASRLRGFPSVPTQPRATHRRGHCAHSTPATVVRRDPPVSSLPWEIPAS